MKLLQELQSQAQSILGTGTVGKWLEETRSRVASTHWQPIDLGRINNSV